MLNVPLQAGPRCPTAIDCAGPQTSAEHPAQPPEPEHFLLSVEKDVYLTAQIRNQQYIFGKL